MKKILYALFLLTSLNAFADDATVIPPAETGDDIMTMNEYLGTIDPASTICATEIYANALKKSATPDMESLEEIIIRKWIYDTMTDPNVIREVLKCPEITGIDENEQIKFMPIKYTFPAGREITVNYETQPKVLKQHLLLAEKRSLPETDPNPKLSSADGTIWVNTDPAWYGIMVVEHGALNQFVGPDKNNTLSIKYIDQNIDSLYPQNWSCTSKTAWANDTDAINEAGVKTIGIGDDDSNDYYVAGDASLEWVGYAEIALDIVITIATAGGGTLALGATKSARMSKAIKNLSKILRRYELGEIKSPAVKKYIKNQEKLIKKTNEILDLKNAKGVDNSAEIAKKKKELEKLHQQAKEFEKIDDVMFFKNNTNNVAEYMKYRQHATKLEDKLKALRKSNGTVGKVDNTPKIKQIDDEIKQFDDNLSKLQKEINEFNAKGRKNNTQDYQQHNIRIKKQKELQYKKAQKVKEKRTLQSQDSVEQTIDNTEEIKKLEKQLENTKDKIKKFEKLDDVSEYNKARKQYHELKQHMINIKRLTTPSKQTGNVVARSAKRTWEIAKGIKAAWSGGSLIRKARKLGKASKFSGQARDWLFNTTLKNLGRLSKAFATTGIGYSVLKGIGDMWDFTETSTGEFTNNIEFKPLLLLSADDIPEYENVVNYGMWLLWKGHSFSAADDDAAFLQAMDFAGKFHEDLMEVQGETNSPCNVDIYVVRPIIRNPDSPDAQLYYLIMNDQPWTTADI